MSEQTCMKVSINSEIWLSGNKKNNIVNENILKCRTDKRNKKITNKIQFF